MERSEVNQSVKNLVSIGDKVLAMRIVDSKNKKIYLYGEGVYKGRTMWKGSGLYGIKEQRYKDIFTLNFMNWLKDQPESKGLSEDDLEEITSEELEKSMLSHTILMDNGLTVWGGQCSWMPATHLPAYLEAGYELTHVDIGTDIGYREQVAETGDQLPVNEVTDNG